MSGCRAWYSRSRCRRSTRSSRGADLPARGESGGALEAGMGVVASRKPGPADDTGPFRRRGDGRAAILRQPPSAKRVKDAHLRDQMVDAIAPTWDGNETSLPTAPLRIECSAARHLPRAESYEPHPMAHVVLGAVRGVNRCPCSRHAAHPGAAANGAASLPNLISRIHEELDLSFRITPTEPGGRQGDCKQIRV